MSIKIIKGDICFSENQTKISYTENGYLVYEDNRIIGVYEQIPEDYQGAEILDYSGHLVVPGLSDLHVHAPQFAYRGLGMDMELLEWLETYAFPEEAKYASLDYAERAYRMFADDLRKSPTTRFAAFGTIDANADVRLAEILEETGLHGYVGKVNMDRNSPDYYIEESAEASIEATTQWLEKMSKLHNIKPIITPRFTPSCTDELMKQLGALANEKGLPVQSHLSENLSEIEWVKELWPSAENYIDTYLKSDLLDQKTIMAHCVHSDEKELNMMKEKGVYAAHCPQCNMNVASGIAPVRKWLNIGVSCGLGSDVAGGATLSIFRTMMEASQVSKLVWRLIDQDLKPLTMEETFWMGTMGGGSFFGNVGTFKEGYEVDVLVLDESRMPHPQSLTLKQRLERYICLSESGDLCHKFVAGKQLF